MMVAAWASWPPAVPVLWRGRAPWRLGRGRGCRQALAVHAVSRPGHSPRDYPVQVLLLTTMVLRLVYSPGSTVD